MRELSTMVIFPVTRQLIIPEATKEELRQKQRYAKVRRYTFKRISGAVYFAMFNIGLEWPLVNGN